MNEPANTMNRAIRSFLFNRNGAASQMLVVGLGVGLAAGFGAGFAAAKLTDGRSSNLSEAGGRANPPAVLADLPGAAGAPPVVRNETPAVADRPAASGTEKPVPPPATVQPTADSKPAHAEPPVPDAAAPKFEGKPLAIDAPGGSGTVEFVWVSKGKDPVSGFWISKKEQSEAPSSVRLPLVVKTAKMSDKLISLRSPTADEWLAAAKAGGLEDMDSGFAEILADGRIIGRADRHGRVLENFAWNVPLDRAKRLEATRGKGAPASANETGPALLAAVRNELGVRLPAPAILANQASYRAQLLRQRQAQNDAKAKDDGEKEFRHRWVIDPPLP